MVDAMMMTKNLVQSFWQMLVDYYCCYCYYELHHLLQLMIDAMMTMKNLVQSFWLVLVDYCCCYCRCHYGLHHLHYLKNLFVVASSCTHRLLSTMQAGTCHC